MLVTYTIEYLQIPVIAVTIVRTLLGQSVPLKHASYLLQKLSIIILQQLRDVIW